MRMQRFFHLLKLQLLCAFMLAILICPFTRELPAQLSDPTKTGQPQDKETAFYQARAFVNGRPVPADVYDRALNQWRKIPKALVARGPSIPSSLTSLHGVVWTPIGPSPLQQGTDQVNGRPHAIAVNPNNPNVLYHGADIGGVWRSNDAGAHWTPLFDQQPAMGIGQPGAIAVDPSDTNTIYVGTSARFQFSQGIFKSTDGGGSWIVLGSGYPANNTGNAFALFQGQNVNRIIVEPSNSNVLYLVASNGLFRSTDAGQNWTQGTNGGDSGGGNRASTLSLDTTSPTNARILYAGMRLSGIRRSTDGGQTWTQILNTATPAVAAALPPGGGIGKVVAALAPSTNPPNSGGIQVLYTTIEGTGGAPDPLGIFQSTDGGTTWTQQTATGLGTCQCSFTMQMSVDPASPGDGTNDILLWGGTNQVRSTDSGANFTDISNGQHVDTRAEWVFVPQPPPTPSIIYTGNDGGIYRSTDDGAHWTGTGLPGAPATINAGGLQTCLFYQMDLKRDATASVTLGSLQDNGSAQTTGIPLWTSRTGGDGFDVVFDRISLNDAFEIHNVSATTDGIFMSNDSGTTFAAVAAAGVPPGELGIFGNQINIDPSNAGFIYLSGSASSVFQSTDAGANFRNIGNLGGGIGETDVAPANANNVVAAVGAQVWVSTNALAPAGVTFTNITRNLPNRSVAAVAFDPNDPTVIIAVLSGFNSGTPGQPGHVFRTTIGGSTWTDISPPVDVPFNAIVFDSAPSPTTIYVGTDLGVLRSVDGGVSWTVLDDLHLPNIPVTDLKINEQAGVLRASTFGRGVFEFTAASGPVIAVNAENGLQFGNACAGTPQYLTITVFNVGTSDLVINSVQRLIGSTDFSVLPNPPTPITISPNSHVDFTVQYNPVTPGMQQATIRITSNDPAAPNFDLTATGTQVTPDIRVTGSTTFGNVCPGASAERTISVCNVGACNLHVTGASVDCPDFTLVNNPFPATVSPDSCLNLVIRFTPTSPGPHSCTLTITSDDPDTPVIHLTLTANTPAPSIDVPLDATFPPTVIQSIGPCHSANPFPISNTGSCNLTITNITIGGPNAGDYSLSGLPSFPIILEPGHIVGEGDLSIVFSPTVVARERRASIDVTYESNPITHSTTTVTRLLCGEGVTTGARVLVTAAGVPLASVKKIQLQRLTVNKDSDVVHNAPLQTVTPTLPCMPFQFHREYGTVSNPIQLLTGSYQVTVQATINGHNRTQTAAFGLGTCDFNPNVVVNFP